MNALTGWTDFPHDMRKILLEGLSLESLFSQLVHSTKKLLTDTSSSIWDKPWTAFRDCITEQAQTPVHASNSPVLSPSRNTPPQTGYLLHLHSECWHCWVPFCPECRKIKECFNCKNKQIFNLLGLLLLISGDQHIKYCKVPPTAGCNIWTWSWLIFVLPTCNDTSSLSLLVALSHHSPHHEKKVLKSKGIEI